MNLRPIIDDIAGQAEDVLADCKDRAEARAALAEFLPLEYPRLASADHKIIADHVLALLGEEGFFAERFVDSFDPDQNASDDADD